MSAAMDIGIDMENAAERSGVYRALAHAFTYDGQQTSPFGISGADYNDAFDPSVNEHACSLCEGAHTEEDRSSLFEELMRFYDFFGLGRGEAVEMPDHLSVELEFMHFLTHLESQVADRPDDLFSVKRAQRDFLMRHLSRLVDAVRKGLKTDNPQCVELVETCHEFVSAEVALAKEYAETS